MVSSLQFFPCVLLTHFLQATSSRSTTLIPSHICSSYVQIHYVDQFSKISAQVWDFYETIWDFKPSRMSGNSVTSSKRDCFQGVVPAWPYMLKRLLCPESLVSLHLYTAWISIKTLIYPIPMSILPTLRSLEAFLVWFYGTMWWL